MPDDHPAAPSPRPPRLRALEAVASNIARYPRAVTAAAAVVAVIGLVLAFDGVTSRAAQPAVAEGVVECIGGDGACSEGIVRGPGLVGNPVVSLPDGYEQTGVPQPLYIDGGSFSVTQPVRVSPLAWAATLGGGLLAGIGILTAVTVGTASWERPRDPGAGDDT